MNQQTPTPGEMAMCAQPEFQRLSVNINAECAQILRMVKARRGINTTEAIRRAIGLLGMFERAAVAAAGAEPYSARDSGDGSTSKNENPNPERW